MARCVVALSGFAEPEQARSAALCSAAGLEVGGADACDILVACSVRGAAYKARHERRAPCQS